MSFRDHPTGLDLPGGPDPLRRLARRAGVLYLLTFVSIPTLLLYRPVNDHTDFVLGAGSTTGVVWGALSEIVVAIAGVGTAVVLYPVTRRQSRTAALGRVTARDLFLGWVLYRAGLVPRVLPVIALVGAPVLLASDIAVLFGGADRISAVTALAALPVAVFEFSLGVYLLVHGFRPVAVATLGGPDARAGHLDPRSAEPVPLLAR